MVNIGIGIAALTAFLGYAVVFLGIVFLMYVISIMGKCLKSANSASKPAMQTANNVAAHAGLDPKKVAAITAAIAEYEGEAN